MTYLNYQNALIPATIEWMPEPIWVSLLYFILDICLKLLHMECLKASPWLWFSTVLNCCFKWNVLICISTRVSLPRCWQQNKPWEDANALLCYTSPFEKSHRLKEKGDFPQTASLKNWSIKIQVLPETTNLQLCSARGRTWQSRPPHLQYTSEAVIVQS